MNECVVTPVSDRVIERMISGYRKYWGDLSPDVFDYFQDVYIGHTPRDFDLAEQEDC